MMIRVPVVGVARRPPRGVAHQRRGAHAPGRGPAASPGHPPPPQEQTRQPDRRVARARSYCAGAYSSTL